MGYNSEDERERTQTAKDEFYNMMVELMKHIHKGTKKSAGAKGDQLCYMRLQDTSVRQFRYLRIWVGTVLGLMYLFVLEFYGF